MLAPPPTHLVEVADGRRVAVDEVGAPDGTPIVYIHGTPDTRRARHPDDSLAAALGVRLVCVDRPGFGASDCDPHATFESFGRDLGILLDRLAIGDARLLAWSAGAPWLMGAASLLAERVKAVAIAAGTVPAEAYADPAVRAAAGEARLGMHEAATDLGAWDAAEMMAPMLVPDPPTIELAREQLAAHEPTTLAELASIPGALDRMAEAMVDSIAGGQMGLIVDVARAYAPSTLDLGEIACPVRLWYGSEDSTCPPAFGRWYADRVPRAEMTVVEGASHGLLLTHWSEVLADLEKLA